MNFSHNSSVLSSDWMSWKLMIANVVLEITIFLIAVLGNLLVIYTIKYEKKLHTTCNFLLLHLAISDINLVVFNIPFDIVFLLNKDTWILGEVMCRLLYPICTIFYISGALILTVISLDRYRVFVQTFKAKLRRAQAKKLIIMVYMLASFSVIPYALSLEVKNGMCMENWSRILFRKLYTIFLFLIQYAIPLAIMIVVYVSIARHLTRKTERVSISGLGTDAKISLFSSSTKLRSDELRKKRKRKALKTIVTVVILFCAFMLPYQLLWIVAEFQEMDEKNFSKLKKLFVIFSYIGSCTINPFIYGIGNRKFRKGYRRFLNDCILSRRKMSRKGLSSRDTKSTESTATRDES